MPQRFDDSRTQYGYVNAVFDQVAAGERPATISLAPSTRHVGVTRRDTRRRGFDEAVRAAESEGYPVLVRGAGGGATAAGAGTFGFSIIRPAAEDARDMRERYDEAAALALAAFERLGVRAEVGEVREEFCPGDHSIRYGGHEDGMKLAGIAQRLTRRATSVGGIVLVYGEKELARVLAGVYGALDLSFRPESVGSLRRAGAEVTTGKAISAFAEEAVRRYGASSALLDERTLEIARSTGGRFLARPAGASHRSVEG